MTWPSRMARNRGWIDSRAAQGSLSSLGDYFFQTDSLFYAKQNHEKIINNFKNSPMFNYALYRLGWVYLDLAESEKAAKTFLRVAESMNNATSRVAVAFKEHVLVCADHAKKFNASP